MSVEHVNLETLVVPTVFRGRLNWDVCKWSLNDWLQNFGRQKMFSLRSGEFKCSNTPLWERNSMTESMIADDFFNLMNTDIDYSKKWFYYDYKHVDQCFKKDNFLKDLSWSCLNPNISTPNGFTFWMGTAGAHTPMHYDTYGINIVGQVYGRKLWILFPPNASKLLRPTRIPYEESSVYSSFNMFCFCNSLSDELLGLARFIILEPGDILFVPAHWWHFVENVSHAISINSWISYENNGDDINNLDESLVKTFISSFVKDLTKEDAKLVLNPNEDCEMDVSNLNLIKHVLQTCKRNIRRKTGLSSQAGLPSKSELPEKNSNEMHTSLPIENLSSSTVRVIKKNVKDNEIIEVPTVGKKTIKNWLVGKCAKNHPSTEVENSVDSDVFAIINSVCSPEIISAIREKILHFYNFEK